MRRTRSGRKESRGERRVDGVILVTVGVFAVVLARAEAIEASLEGILSAVG
jgi:hypothetical protein